MAPGKVLDLTTENFMREITDINPKYDDSAIIKAYEIALRLHEGQFRKSGEPYIIHPIAVAKILAGFGMDNETVIAGLLHDVVEDTDYTREQLVQDFDEKIAALVDGVTKLGNISFDTSSEKVQAENFRKMFLAMSKDIRVLIIKLADRLHNMRTLEYMPTNKRESKALETLEIYAPLAGRLGMFSIKFELEDLALKFLHRIEYKKLLEAVTEKREKYEKDIETLIAEISFELDKAGIQHEVKGRSKHMYSIYRKMVLQNKQLDEIFDLLAVRILVSSVKDCYAALGMVHTRWKPIPGRFKDYIAMPKPNMYQSLHTTVIGDNGEPYIIHPIAVAKILAGFGMDNETVIAGLLHDVVEDTDYTREQLVKDFDEKIAQLVDGVTKLGNISYDTSSEKVQAEKLEAKKAQEESLLNLYYI